MPQATLKLFRRHDSACVRSYTKEDRIYESDIEKRKGKTSRQDCSCTIYAEGTLYRADGSKHYLRPRATGGRKWDDAKTVASRWIAWGDVEPPAPTLIVPKANELVTVKQATGTFIASKSGNTIGDGRTKDIELFFDLRLIPFAEKMGIQFIQEMDNAEVWSQFRRSWKNLNPLKNRKPEPGQKIPDRSRLWTCCVREPLGWPF